MIGFSLGEEILYRGFLITRLIEIQRDSRAARWLAVTVSGVVFGLAHFAWGPAGMVQTAFMGLALDAALLLTKRALWVLVLAHAYGDTILMTQMYLGAGGAFSPGTASPQQRTRWVVEGPPSAVPVPFP